MHFIHRENGLIETMLYICCWAWTLTVYKLLSVYELTAALDMVHRVLTDDDTFLCSQIITTACHLLLTEVPVQ